MYHAKLELYCLVEGCQKVRQPPEFEINPPTAVICNRCNLNLVNDEVKAYQDSRFIGCTEAIWRTFEMKLRDRYPPVMKLAIHLEGQQSVLFQNAKLTP